MSKRSGRGEKLTVEQQAQAVVGGLRRLIEELVRTHPQYLDAGGLPEQLEVPVLLGEGRSDADLASGLLTTLRRTLSEVAFSDAIVQGHLFCFQCQSADCAHSQPPDAQSVFVGYAATGKPSYLPFSRACLDLAPEAAERLFSDDGGFVCLIWDGHRLRERLLEDFGKESRAFRVIGQLAVGYLTIDGERRVLSLIPVVLQRPGAPMRVLLNVLGVDERLLISGDFAFDAENLYQAIRRTRARLAGLRKRQRAIGPRDGKVPSLEQLAEAELTQTKGVVERLFRRSRRSTQHARERRKDQRPIAAAMADLSGCRDEDLFLDARRNTVVAVGAKGRVHIFSWEGQHVTSFKLDREAVQRRVERKRWCPLSDEQLVTFRGCFAG